MQTILRFRPDGFLLLLAAMLVLATLTPARGLGADVFADLTSAAITILFFLHGAKLSRQAIAAGIGAWRLHLLVSGFTFAVFPVLALGTIAALGTTIDPAIANGLLFLAIVPSTVQSSIAMTAIGGGNVPAAVCTASLSNVAGIFLTPLLAGLLISGSAAENGHFLSALGNIAKTLLLPFVLGHFCRPLIGRFIDRHRAMVMRVDRGAILLVVYTAFSAAVVEGLWYRLAPFDLVVILLIDVGLLAAVLLLSRLSARLCDLPREDEIVLVFCGSKKSLASGVPLAGALFSSAQAGIIILPLMLFHQLQLIICAAIAQNYRKSPDGSVPTGGEKLPT